MNDPPIRHKESEEIEKKATPDWTCGRADMQSYTIGGIPFKNLYNDKICKEREAGVIYGENSIYDSQMFIHSRNNLSKFREALKKAVEALEKIQRVGYGLELNSDDTEGAEYWARESLANRQLSREALAEINSMFEEGK